MPRRPRVLIEGGLYHVYNRFARGEAIFADPREVGNFLDIFREVKKRDGLTLYAFCVLSNHYHFAMKTSAVPLSRTMRHLQWGFSRAFNLRMGRTGPLWQSRYKAKLVEDEQYFDQLVVYIHLNPVRVGVVSDPAEYVFGGHRELMGRVAKPLLDIDDALQVFGGSLREARQAYGRRIQAAMDEQREGESLSSLPWWEEGDRALRPGEGRMSGTGTNRPKLDAGEFLALACRILRVEITHLASNRRDRPTTHLRQLVATLGIERWSQQAGRVARLLDKHPVVVSRWVRQGGRRAADDREFAKALNALDKQCQDASAKTVPLI